MTKAFDIPNGTVNSIDAVLNSSAFDVLIWTSEDKEHSEAQYLDQEVENSKNRIR